MKKHRNSLLVLWFYATLLGGCAFEKATEVDVASEELILCSAEFEFSKFVGDQCTHYALGTDRVRYECGNNGFDQPERVYEAYNFVRGKYSGNTYLKFDEWTRSSPRAILKKRIYGDCVCSRGIDPDRSAFQQVCMLNGVY